MNPPVMSAKTTRPKTIIRLLTILCVCIALGMLGLGSLMLLDARQEVWRQAEQASANLAVALEREISRNILTLDLSLQGVIDATRLPGIDQVSPDIRRMALFDRSATAEFMGAILLIDASGYITEQSSSLAPRHLYLGDRDYFQVHKKSPDAGLYVSSPYLSRLETGEPRIAISRRLPSSDERFTGIVLGSLRLQYFQALFGKLQLGNNGSVSVVRTDGQLIARYPFQPTDFGLNVSASNNFRRTRVAPSGTFEAVGSIDGIKRLYTFRQVHDLPLILSVGLAVDEVYAAWWRKAAIIGSLLFGLCAATVGLCLLLRRELLRRMTAETALVQAAEKLTEMASTDGLTGLANRRSFDLTLKKEWRRAIRGQMPIALLMLDADCFKSYNDHYGHPEGDRVLQAIATCMQQHLRRPSDFATRYGGEEFIVLLPETEFTGALVVAELIRGEVERLNIPHVGGPAGKVTVSVGLAVMYPQPDTTGDPLTKEADEALYDAKRTGRNRVSYAPRCEASPKLWISPGQEASLH